VPAPVYQCGENRLGAVFIWSEDYFIKFNLYNYLLLLKENLPKQLLTVHVPLLPLLWLLFFVGELKYLIHKNMFLILFHPKLSAKQFAKPFYLAYIKQFPHHNHFSGK